MSYLDQPLNVQSPGIVVPVPANDPAVEALALPAVVGEAMIERAKSVVAVAQRVDDDEAEQILLEAASKADIPVRLAADQVMTALEAQVSQEGITHDALERAVAAVRPVEQPEDDDPLPERPDPQPAHQAA